MKVLFDHNVPFDLRLYLTRHLVITADQMGWSQLSNGDLLKAAEEEGYEIFVTSDQSIFYQQNNSKRTIALVVLNTNHWGRISRQAELVSNAVDSSVRSGFTLIEFEPLTKRRCTSSQQPNPPAAPATETRSWSATAS